MATAKRPIQTEMEGILECPVCLERFTDPRVLPCQHTLCLKCLEQHVRTTFNNIFRTFCCPECRKRHNIPRGGVEHFPTNFLINKLSDIHSDCAASEPTPGTSAEVHNTETECVNSSIADPHGETVAHCKQCSESFCEQCRDWHQKFKATREHELIESRKQTAEPQYCSVHKGNPFNKFCETCKVLVCSTCPEIQEAHHLHHCIDIQNAAETRKSELPECKKLLTDRLAHLQDLPRETTATENKIKVEAFAAKQKISSTTEAMCQMVRLQGEQLAKQVLDIEKEALAKAATVRSQQLSQLRQLQSLQTKVNDLSGMEDDSCIVTGFTKLKGDIKELFHTPLQKLQWRSKVNYGETNGLKEILGKVRKEKTTESSGPTETPKTPETTDISPANLGLHHVIRLEVTRRPVTGIAIAIGHIFVTHLGNNNLWVYTKDGRFVRSVTVNWAKQCSGLATLDAESGLLAVTDQFGGELHFVQVCMTPVLRVYSQSSYHVHGGYCGLTSDNNNYVMLTTRQPYELLIYELDNNSCSGVNFSGVISLSQARDPTSAVRTSQGFAVFSDLTRELVQVDDYGRRVGQQQIWVPTERTNAVAGDMCIANLHKQVIFVADREHNYIHMVDIEGGQCFPCALSLDEGICEPLSLCWDDATKSLLVAQHKPGGGQGFEVRVYAYRERAPKEPRLVPREETTHMDISVNLPKLE